MAQFSVFCAMSIMVTTGDFLSGGLVSFAFFFIVFEVSIEIESKKKGKK
jgi:hypothetical protein